MTRPEGGQGAWQEGGGAWPPGAAPGGAATVQPLAEQAPGQLERRLTTEPLRQQHVRRLPHT